MSTNPASSECASTARPFALNPALDLHLFEHAFRANRRVHLSNFLLPADAARLFQVLKDSVSWRTYVVANERQLATPSGYCPTAVEERELVDMAYTAARTGFASLLDADKLQTEPRSALSVGQDPMIEFEAFLNSPTFLRLARRITGIDELSTAETQCLRLRAGQFVMFQAGTDSADLTGKRRVNFVADLTPEWRPDWGGLLEFRQFPGHLIEAIQPCFNLLSLFAFPMGHWFSGVAPFAGGARYSIRGSIYAE